MNAPVRDTATVTVTEAVSGQRKYTHTERRGRSSSVTTIRVDRRVLARARKVCRPGERLRIVSATVVETVYER